MSVLQSVLFSFHTVHINVLLKQADGWTRAAGLIYTLIFVHTLLCMCNAFTNKFGYLALAFIQIRKISAGGFFLAPAEGCSLRMQTVGPFEPTFPRFSGRFCLEVLFWKFLGEYFFWEIFFGEIFFEFFFLIILFKEFFFRETFFPGTFFRELFFGEFFFRETFLLEIFLGKFLGKIIFRNIVFLEKMFWEKTNPQSHKSSNLQINKSKNPKIQESTNKTVNKSKSHRQTNLTLG